MKRRNIALLLFLLIAVPPYYWLLVDGSARDVPDRRIDIAQLRELASAMPGPLPDSVEVESVARRRVRRTLLAAGTGLKRQSVHVQAFRLPVPGRGAVLIDAGITARDAARLGWSEHSPAAQARVEAARRTASLVLLTDASADNTGGLPAPASPDRDDQPRAVAPGIVIIPAPAHAPGSRMIYARLANGREYLFAGDLAPLALNLQKQRPTARLLGRWLAPQNRGEMLGWLRAIARLRQQAPEVVIVPGHDHDYLADARLRGGFRAGFSVPATPAAAH